MKIFLKISLLAAMAFSQSLADDSQQLRRQTQENEADDSEEEGFDHYGFESRIVGGSVTTGNDYPFHVNLGGCGGSLIHEDIVLTAAHCQPLYPSSVRIGGGNRNSGIQRGVVGYGTPHPNYNTRSQDYDFMVYKLDSPVQNQAVVPLNTNPNNPNPNADDTLTVIGFGSTYEGGSGSFRLREVDVNHVSYNSCNFAYRGQIEEDIMFCAGVEGGGRDTCQGDSGGPIVDADGFQVGVTSWGNGCARKGYPGVYARVSAAYDWIQKEICSQSENPPATCKPNNDNTYGSNQDNIDEDDQDNTADGTDEDNTADDTDENNNTEEDNPLSDLIQPKGISIRVDITFDEYPQENAWVLYRADTQEELYFSDYGEITSPGLHTKIFPDMDPGRYVFLMLDEYWDGICCRYGNGQIQVYQIFPEDSGRGDEIKWNHDGKFWNAAGAIFVVEAGDDRRSLQESTFRVESENIGDSPYLSVAKP